MNKRAPCHDFLFLVATSFLLQVEFFQFLQGFSLLLYFSAKLNLSKLPRFLYMNQQLTCNKLRKMD